MDSATTDPGIADTAAAAAAHPYGPDRRAAELAERQVALLGQIAEDGAALVHVIRKQAEQANWCGSEGPEMFERLARAVRQTIAFQIKVDADARLTCEQRAAAYARREAAEVRALTKTVNRSVSTLGAEIRQLAAEIEEEAKAARGPKTDRENLLSGLKERFGDPSVDSELNGRTYGEILRTILEDTGLTADLSIFTPEQLARVYGPARWRRQGAASAPPAAAPAGDGGGSEVPGAPAAPADPPAQGPPDVAKAHDPP
jgi:hypothetical protein